MKKTSCILIAASASILLTACASNPEATRLKDRENVKQELAQEMSLKEDRDSLKDLRKEVPVEAQKNNDELALFLGLVRQGTENPQIVRDKFNSLVQKKRSGFREKVQTLRDKFRSDETKKRDAFLAEQKSKRDAFLRRKKDAKQTREFLSDQDKERMAFFADERARRQSFESELNAQSKDFDSYMRERQKEFDEQYRLYSKKFSEKPKEKKAVTGDEFRRLEDSPATPLGTED